MVRRIAVALFLVTGMLFMGGTIVDAGGWASVRVTSKNVDPNDPQSLSMTVMVLQHDKTPFAAESLIAHFVNTESGAEFDVEGVASGETGVFALSVVFPESGNWAWTVTPAPFEAVNMETITIATSSEVLPGYSIEATIWPGDCLNLGAAIESFPLVHSVDQSGTVVDSGTAPGFDTLLSSSDTAYAISIFGEVDGKVVKKCREVTLSPNPGPIDIPELTTSNVEPPERWTLLPNDDGTAATLITVAQTVHKSVTVQITDIGGGAFDPPQISVPVGTTVTWVNTTAISHTVSGKQLTFANSGMLDPGAMFSQTFETPGTYNYACDPHSWMTGTVIVTES